MDENNPFVRVLILAQQERERRQIAREQQTQQQAQAWARVVGLLRRADERARQKLGVSDG